MVDYRIRGVCQIESDSRLCANSVYDRTRWRALRRVTGHSDWRVRDREGRERKKETRSVAHRFWSLERATAKLDEAVYPRQPHGGLD